MRSAAPELLPIFRSMLQADILAALLLNPEREYSLTDLAHRLDAPLARSAVRSDAWCGRACSVAAAPGDRP